MQESHTRRYLFPGLITLVAIAFLITLLIQGFGGLMEGGDETSPVVSAAAEPGPEVFVELKMFRFHPSKLAVKPGTTVTFVNVEPIEHNVVHTNGGLFESPMLGEGETFSFTFTDEGTYEISCLVGGHNLVGMVGEVIVTNDPALLEEFGVEDAASAAAVDTTPAPVPDSDTDHMASHHAHADSFEWGANVLEPVRVDEENGIYEFEIWVEEITVELIDGVEVTAWAYNGTLPGPEIRVPEGSRVKVHFTNTHHQPHTIHWHGIHADQRYDGVAPVIMPGETYTYEFDADTAGTYFYHCHFDSYRHVDMGMYGPLIVEPAEGTPYGVDAEYTMIFDDWDSHIDPNTLPWSPEYDYFLVNGRAHPHIPNIEVARDERILVRFINAGYNNVPMHLHGVHFEVVASDGRELPAPYLKDTLDVAPGERYDIIISGDRNPGSFPFHSHNLKQVTNAGYYPGGIHLMVDFVDPAE